VPDEHAIAWPEHLPVTQVRFARPTTSLDAALHFYRDCLGLAELSRFADHAGYDGAMLGLPGTGHHLELTEHPDVDGSVSTKEHLLVLYVGSDRALAPIVDRLRAGGYPPVAAENPYWTTVGAVTIEDPDGWRLVLVPGPGL
jgi:catechol 2,3-dioxygenase-like lactoylglutathione lyase family enzyme